MAVCLHGLTFQQQLCHLNELNDSDYFYKGSHPGTISKQRSRVLTLPSIILVPAALLLDKPFCLQQIRHHIKGSTSPRVGDAVLLPAASHREVHTQMMFMTLSSLPPKTHSEIPKDAPSTSGKRLIFKRLAPWEEQRYVGLKPGMPWMTIKKPCHL